MPELYDVRVKIISQEGHCVAGHQVGEEWTMGKHTPEGICLAAFQSLLPTARVLRFGGLYPQDDPEMHNIACPDEVNPVVFEVRRINK